MDDYSARYAADLRAALTTAQSEAAELRKEVERLRDALKPFVDHLNEMRFDIDNNGNELSDDLAVGWIYLTNGDFRRARAALKETQHEG